MKKNIFIAALAALTLCFAACQKEDITVDNGNGNGIVNPNARVKTTSDLIGTNWVYNFSLITDCDTVDFGEMAFLTFDNSYAHFSFADNVEAYNLSTDGLSLEQISSIDYNYSYDGTTHTGTLNSTFVDEDGNTVPAHLDFTYDDDNDEITLIVPLAFDGDTNTTDYPVVFTRNE